MAYKCSTETEMMNRHIVDHHKKYNNPSAAAVSRAKHPGFKAVQSKIQSEGYTKEQAGAILASKTRAASASAKKANPHLKRVKG